MAYNQFGEIISENYDSSGNRNRNTTPRRQEDNGFSGWWIIVLLLLIFIVYEIVSTQANSKEKSSQLTTKTDNSQYLQQQPNYTSPSNSNSSSSELNKKVNPYGFGNGKLTFYKTCNSCTDLSVYIDGEYLGMLTQTLSSASCDDYGTLNKVLSTGNHSIKGTDSEGDIYENMVYINEGECSLFPFTKANDVKFNPYGEGNGKLTFYKTCNNCPDLDVYVDGSFVGTLTQTFSNTPSCDDYGTLNKILSIGNHSITGKDSYGTLYNGTTYVYEGLCTTNPFTKTDDVKPNLYGNGNGQIVIYHSCSSCNNVQVSIDGYYSGTLTKYYQNGNPSCGTTDYGGTIVRNLLAGNHTITGKDDYGNSWSGYVYVGETDCKTYALENFTQGNPYGYGKGKASFWTDQDVFYDLYIDGYFQTTISQHFLSGEPTCGQNGTVSSILSEGTHSFSAKESRGEWKGTFYVTAGQCVNVKVNKY